MLFIEEEQLYSCKNNNLIQEENKEYITEILCFVQENNESGYQMYLSDGNNDDIYFNDLDDLLDILELEFSDLDDRIKNISYIENDKEYRFKANDIEYSLGEL